MGCHGKKVDSEDLYTLSDADEERDWESLGLTEFFRGYSDEDAIYDQYLEDSMATKQERWRDYGDWLFSDERIGFAIDVCRMEFTDDLLAKMAPAMARAFDGIDAIERGEIANTDEERKVGHYWLRDSSRAEPTLRDQINPAIDAVKSFASKVLAGSELKVGDKKSPGVPFKKMLVIGIGGSALGPQFVASALADRQPGLATYFFDNTDPDGIDRTLKAIGDDLKHTLVVVISKSGSTPETKNGMLEAEAAFKKKGLDFPLHAVAITGDGSDLDKYAANWLARFPMWDWVGGRTSVTSAVGLLPAAFQGIDIDGLLAGAREMDELTRRKDIRTNPAALLALAWHHATGGKGKKDMVILPYKDRLELFSRYLQQLVMESLGKKLDRAGNVVYQGIAVYGNKGSTDQHAYVQQLRDGINNFFVTFIEVLKDRDGESIAVDKQGMTSGDYLQGFLRGTRDALSDEGRQSLTITIDSVSPRSVGQLIALFERAVSIYAELINVNAYHQPGVEAGKKAAKTFLEVQMAAEAFLRTAKNDCTAREIAAGINLPDEVEAVFHALNHLAKNSRKGISIIDGAKQPDHRKFRFS